MPMRGAILVAGSKEKNRSRRSDKVVAGETQKVGDVGTRELNLRVGQHRLLVASSRKSILFDYAEYIPLVCLLA